MPDRTAADSMVASVIMPAWNAGATLTDQLEAMIRQDAKFNWELLLVDNGSSDGTLEMAEDFRDRIASMRVLHCGRRGANAARNKGAEAALSDLLLFCDADDIADAGWVRAMAGALTAHDAAGGRIDNDTFPSGFMPLYPDGLPVSAGFLPRAITANFGVRRAVWKTVGGFSEDYQYGSTDTEFCWRLQLAGFELGYAPEAVVAYRHRSTLSEAARKAYLTGEAQVRLFRDFREAGMPRSTWPRVVFRWGRLVVSSPAAVFSERFRWRWVREVAGASGRVVGSARMRQRYL